VWERRVSVGEGSLIGLGIIPPATGDGGGNGDGQTREYFDLQELVPRDRPHELGAGPDLPELEQVRVRS